MIVYRTSPPPLFSVEELFKAVGWQDYIGSLEIALANSSFVVTAWEGRRLVGLARVVSDRARFSMLHDVAVHEDFRRQGIGSKLVRRSVQAFPHTHFLLTTSDAELHAFYRRLGFDVISGAMLRRR